MCDCDRALSLISLELDGALSPEEAAELEAHLAGCGDCRRAAEELRELHTLLPQLEEEVPPDLHRAIMDRIASEKVVPLAGGKKRGALRRWVSLAAVFAVILLGAGTWQALQGSGGTSGTAAPAALAPEVRDGTASAGASGQTEEEKSKDTEAAPTEVDEDKAVQEAGAADSSAGSVLRMEPPASAAPDQDHSGAAQTVTFEAATEEGTYSGEAVPDRDTVDTLTANAAAWLAASGLEQRDRVDTAQVSVAPATEGELAAAVWDGGGQQAPAEAWAVTLGDTSGHDFVVLLCDSQTLEVLGYVPAE